MTRLRATVAHLIPERPPIHVVPGQCVRAGQRDTQWPAFVFVTTDDGAGWVPERYLDTSSDPAVVITGYETTELATIAGEELTLVEQDSPSEWARVRNAAGREGWVPLNTVEPIPGELRAFHAPSIRTRDRITSSAVRCRQAPHPEHSANARTPNPGRGFGVPGMSREITGLPRKDSNL